MANVKVGGPGRMKKMPRETPRALGERDQIPDGAHGRIDHGPDRHVLPAHAVAIDAEADERPRRAATIEQRVRVEEIPVDAIVVGADDTRDATAPGRAEKDAALRESIRAKGLLQPIGVVRRVIAGSMDGVDPPYEIIYGRRRLAATKALGRNTIPAVVFDALAAGESAELAAIENLQRADLNPFEEAAECATLAAWHDAAGTADVAAILGWTQRKVEQRLALHRLDPRVKAFVLDGTLPLGHAEVIARLADHEAQLAIARGARRDPGQDWSRGEPISYVRSRVDQELRALDGVPWKLDVEFAGKPACSQCAQNSANAVSLFDKAPKRPMCLERACFAVKREAAKRVVDSVARRIETQGAKPTAAVVKQIETERSAAAASTSGKGVPLPILNERKVADVLAEKQERAAERSGGKQRSGSGGGNAATEAYKAHEKEQRERENWENARAPFEAWAGEVDELVVAAAARAPAYLAMMELAVIAINDDLPPPAGMPCEWWERTRAKEREKAARKWQPLLDRLAVNEASGEDVLKCVKTALGLVKKAGRGLWGDQERPLRVLLAAARGMGLKLPEMPKLEERRSDAATKATQPETPPAGKKKRGRPRKAGR